MDSQQRERVHPIMILFNLRQFFILAIIPIFRGLITAIKGDLALWSEGIWLDIGILLLILAFAVARWWRCSYTADDLFITQREGLFFSRSTQLPWDRVTVLKVNRPFYLRPFRACFFRADSLGGSYQNCDINLVLWKKQGEALTQLYSINQPLGTDPQEIRPSALSVLGLALVSTNSFAGIFYLATFISQSGKLLGNEFSEMLVGTFESFARTLSQHVPPAAAALAYLLVFTWLIGVVFTLLRYAGYSIQRGECTLRLAGGIFSHQEHYINYRQMNYLSIQQNVLTYFFRTYSLYLSAIGCGKERSDITCVIPMEQKAPFEKRLGQLFPTVDPGEITVRPDPLGFMRFLFEPLALCCGILLAIFLGVRVIPSWASFIRFVGYMALVPGLGFLIMRFVEFFTSGIGQAGTTYTLRYSTSFTLHTVLIPKENVSMIKFQQSLFQWMSGSCDLLLYTQSERQSRHRIRNVKRREVETLFGIQSEA